MKALLMLHCNGDRTMLPANIESIMYRLVYALHHDGYWYPLINNHTLDLAGIRYAYHRLMTYKSNKLEVNINDRLK